MISKHGLPKSMCGNSTAANSVWEQPFTFTTSSSSEVRLRVPFVLQSILVGEPSPRKETAKVTAPLAGPSSTRVSSHAHRSEKKNPPEPTWVLPVRITSEAPRPMSATSWPTWRFAWARLFCPRSPAEKTRRGILCFFVSFFLF